MNTSTESAFAAEAHRLAERALCILVERLTRFGNRLGEAHRGVLRAMLHGMAEQAYGLREGRHAYSLFCGGGKTQAVVSLIQAIHESGAGELSMVVAASKVEALCSIYRDLRDAGLPAEEIGLTHCYGFDPDQIDAAKAGQCSREKLASVPATDGPARRFQLVTHARVRKGGTAVVDYATWNGAPRSLIVWDESLIAAEAHSVLIREFLSAHGAFAPFLEGAEGTLGRTLDAVRKELVSALNSERRGAACGSLAPLVDPGDLEDLKGSVETIWRTRRRNLSDTQRDTLLRVLELASDDFRVLAVNGPDNEGLVTYDVTVPASLQWVAILDASFPIRRLQSLDESIRNGLPEGPPAKRYDRCTLHHLPAPAGRAATEKDFLSDRRMCRAVVSVLREKVRPGQAALVFTFKPKGPPGGKGVLDAAEVLREEMRAVGLNPEETVPFPRIGPDGAPRVEQRARYVFLTWGQHESISEHQHAEHVLFCGVLHRSRIDVSATALGQRDMLGAELTHKEVQGLVDSEVAHALYQAVNRSAMRQCDGDQAKAANIWLINRPRPAIREALEKVLPGMRWEPWRDENFENRGTKRRGLEERIRTHLGQIKPSVTKLSVRKLREALDPVEASSNAFSDAIDDALPGTGWVRSGRSIERMRFASVTAEAGATAAQQYAG